MINLNEIAIGVLDLYTQEDLNNCLASIPKELTIGVMANTANIHIPLSGNIQFTKRHSKEVSLATLKNDFIHYLRLNDPKKFIFFIHSNQTIQNSKIFEETVLLAKTFGTWCMTGPSKVVAEVEDDTTKLTATFAETPNTEFLFVLDNLFDHVGFFEERFCNGRDLDTLDFINRLQKKGLAVPPNYYSCILNGLRRSASKIQKIGYEDANIDISSSLKFSYGIFYHLHQYIPGQEDIDKSRGVKKEEMLDKLEQLQKNYGTT